MTDAIRLRRPPPAFRRAEVAAVTERSPRLRRIALAGPELVGLPPADAAASVRLLLPQRGELVLPEWNGNEFLHRDGARPHLRTLTPLRIDPDRGKVDVDIVLHGSGPMASWAGTAAPGDPVAISGTGRGFAVDGTATHVLAGDESALPAITTILERLPRDAEVTVVVEIASPDARLELVGPDGMAVSWHHQASGAPPGHALAEAVEAATIDADARVWVAGEAAAVQRIRRHLFDARGLDRGRATVRGYWKHGRSGDPGAD